jgi:hypothetical protein
MHYVTILKAYFIHTRDGLSYLFVSFHNTFRLTVRKFILITDWSVSLLHPDFRLNKIVLVCFHYIV